MNKLRVTNNRLAIILSGVFLVNIAKYERPNKIK